MRPLGLAGYLFGGFGRPGLRVLAERCLRASGSDCRACVGICPAAALRLGPAGSGEAPQTELTRCTDCGLCAATCPSGAIAGVGVPPGALTREAERQSSSMSVVCGSARREPSGKEGNQAFPISCLAGLHPETVVATALALEPGSALTLVQGQCSGCPGAQRARVGVVVQESVDLLQRLDHGGRRVLLASTKAQASTHRPEVTTHPGTVASRNWSRRDLITAGRSAARPAQAPAVTSPRAELLRYSAGPSSATLQLTHPVDAEGCTFCHACAAVCPTQALAIGRIPTDGTEPDGAAARLELAVDAGRCVGCGQCAHVCVDDLVTLGRAAVRASPDPGRADRLIVLARGQRPTCHECAQPLAPREQGICRRCESASSLVTDFLAM
ncbi:MAG: 4Fe-4S dicluster domain-containing protein [Dermatophilaceae bacterium]